MTSPPFHAALGQVWVSAGTAGFDVRPGQEEADRSPGLWMASSPWRTLWLVQSLDGATSTELWLGVGLEAWQEGRAPAQVRGVVLDTADPPLVDAPWPLADDDAPLRGRFEPASADATMERLPVQGTRFAYTPDAPCVGVHARTLVVMVREHDGAPWWVVGVVPVRLVVLPLPAPPPVQVEGRLDPVLPAVTTDTLAFTATLAAGGTDPLDALRRLIARWFHEAPFVYEPDGDAWTTHGAFRTDTFFAVARGQMGKPDAVICFGFSLALLAMARLLGVPDVRVLELSLRDVRRMRGVGWPRWRYPTLEGQMPRHEVCALSDGQGGWLVYDLSFRLSASPNGHAAPYATRVAAGVPFDTYTTWMADTPSTVLLSGVRDDIDLGRVLSTPLHAGLDTYRLAEALRPAGVKLPDRDLSRMVRDVEDQGLLGLRVDLTESPIAEAWTVEVLGRRVGDGILEDVRWKLKPSTRPGLFGVDWRSRPHDAPDLHGPDMKRLFFLPFLPGTQDPAWEVSEPRVTVRSRRRDATAAEDRWR